MLYSESRPVLGNVGQEELDMLADAKFFLRRIVKNVEGNLVPEPFATEEFL